jgi:hypothetical protein
MAKKKITWETVQQECHLNADIIEKAKRLGITPHTVRANHASTRQERWKTPTAEWIQELYDKRFGDRG